MNAPFCQIPSANRAGDIHSGGLFVVSVENGYAVARQIFNQLPFCCDDIVNRTERLYMLWRNSRDNAHAGAHYSAKFRYIAGAARAHFTHEIPYTFRHIVHRAAYSHGSVERRGGCIGALSQKRGYHVFHARLAVTARYSYADKSLSFVQLLLCL